MIYLLQTDDSFLSTEGFDPRYCPSRLVFVIIESRLVFPMKLFMEELQAKCGGEGNVEECMRTTMCENPKVCCAWKHDNCPNPNCQTQFLSLVKKRSSDKGTGAITNSLDSATSGKCIM